MSRLREFAGTQDLAINLTLRELRGRYKRSVLGWTWSLLNPLATVAIYSLVFGFFLSVDPPTGHRVRGELRDPAQHPRRDGARAPEGAADLATAARDREPEEEAIPQLFASRGEVVHVRHVGHDDGRDVGRVRIAGPLRTRVGRHVELAEGEEDR